MAQISAIDALKQVQQIIQYGNEHPDGVICMRNDYYNPPAIIAALEDIRIRAALGTETKADRLLMQIIAFSMYAPI